MMVSIGIYVRRGRRMLRRWMLDPRLHTLLQTAGWFLAGLCFSAASLSHRPQPIALGVLLALSGWPAVLLAAGGMAGYLLFWGAAGAQGVVWLMAGLLVAVTLGGREVLEKNALLMPAISAVIVAAVGLLFQTALQDTTPIAIYVLRVALAGATAMLFGIALRRRDPVADWLVCGVGVMALAQVMPIPYLGFGYIAAGILAGAGAFPAAALSGLALDLARITPVPMTAVLCLAWLVRLIPAGRKKWSFFAPALVYILVMALCGMWDLMPVPGLLIGGAAALLVPGRQDISHRRGETGIAQVRLEMASSVLNQTQYLLSAVEEAPIDEAALVARAADKACSGCPCRKNCKENPKDMPTTLLHKPLGNGADLPLSCRKSGRLLQELRRSQEQLRSIRADRDRQREYRAAVVQQYHFLSEYLQDLSDALSQRGNTPQAWYQPEVAVCSASRERANGDRCLWFAGVSCRYYVLLCDGMGTGAEAAKTGQRAGELLRKMLAAGFPPEHALRSLNSLCALQGQAGAVTVDLAELRLDTGKAVIYKWGAAPSYVISRGEPVKIGTAAPPPGLSVAEGRETVEKLSLRRGETLVLLSDGAGGEEELRLCWERAGEPVSELAARILESNQTDGADDATVAVVRLSRAPVTT
ncbi:MAG: hypothetical protein E7439_04175 [Ruminococcaceae bacterium]|nr:hypothetical protein [Oscillospiraceae bacterium]